MKFYFRTAELLAEEARRSARGEDTSDDRGRPTVVVETEDGDEAVALWRGLGMHGYRVEWCPGPNSATHRLCTLTATGRCRLVEKADAVLSHLDFERSEARECVSTLRARHPETPLLISVPASTLREFPELAEASDGVLVYPRSADELVGAVGEVVLRAGQS